MQSNDVEVVWSFRSMIFWLGEIGNIFFHVFLWACQSLDKGMQLHHAECMSRSLAAQYQRLPSFKKPCVSMCNTKASRFFLPTQSKVSLSWIKMVLSQSGSPREAMSYQQRSYTPSYLPRSTTYKSTAHATIWFCQYKPQALQMKFYYAMLCCTRESMAQKPSESVGRR